MKVKIESEAVQSCPTLATPWTAAYQAPMSMGFSRPRVNIDILGISELKWTGMGEFNLDDNYIYYCGQESLRRNGVAIVANNRV